MRTTTEFHQTGNFEVFLRSLAGHLQPAAARGLNEHAEEQRRQSVVRITAYTGVPNSRVAGKTRVIKASAGKTAEAKVRTSDTAISLAEYGNPVWVRDRAPGRHGGSPSTMKGAEATAWNFRRQFKGAFIAGGQVVVRTTKNRFPLKRLSMAVLANELAKPTRPNAPAAERYAVMDLERRVMRHVIREIGS